MKTWRRSLAWGSAGRFIENELKEAIKALNRFYHSRKYAEARVRYKVVKDKQTRSVRIDIEIEEGPLYRVEFVGNQMISTRTLSTDLVLFDQGNINNRGECAGAFHFSLGYTF